MIRSEWQRTFLAGGMVVALLGAPLSANATPGDHSVSDAAISAIEAVAPEVFVNLAAARSDAGFKASRIDGVDVRVPANAADGIRLSNGDLSLIVGLPEGTGSSLSTSAPENVTVYDNPEGFQVVPVVKDDGRLQISTVIQSATSPSHYDYELTLPREVTPVLDESGAVFFVDQDGAFAGAVEKPWALDAEGQPVPTHFELRGNVLTQVVDTSLPGIVFPVVADPTVTYQWWGYLIKYSKAETKDIANRAGGGVAAAAAVICGMIPNALARAVCYGLSGYSIGNAYYTASTAASHGRCLQLNVAYAGPIPTTAHEVAC